MHDDNYLEKHFFAFGVPRNKFKKASAKELKKNAKHVKALNNSWDNEMKEKDDNPDKDC